MTGTRAIPPEALKAAVAAYNAPATSHVEALEEALIAAIPHLPAGVDEARVIKWAKEASEVYFAENMLSLQQTIRTSERARCVRLLMERYGPANPAVLYLAMQRMGED